MDRTDQISQSQGKLEAIFDYLRTIIMEGLRHGFFDYKIACETGNHKRRKLVITAGKSQKFTIREEELQ